MIICAARCRADAREAGMTTRYFGAPIPRNEDQRLYTDATADTSRLRDSAGANLALEARLTWRFDRLLYADDEPSFERIVAEQRQCGE